MSGAGKDAPSRGRRRQPSIAPPPRSLPLSWWVHHLVGELGAFASLFAVVGFGLAAVLLSSDEVREAIRLSGRVVRTDGEIVSCIRIPPGRKRPALAAHQYRFTVGGVRLEEGPAQGGRAYGGVSYSRAECAPVGTRVVIEHAVGRPDLSRVAGMSRRRTPDFPVFFLVLPLLFGLVGITLAVLGASTGLRTLRFWRRGRLAEGELVGVERSGKRLALRFGVNEEGTHREVIVKSRSAKTLGVRELIFYDPGEPDGARVWDWTAGSGRRIERSGRLVPYSMRTTFFELLGPLVTLAALTAVIALALSI